MGLDITDEALSRDWSLSFGDIDFVNAKPVSVRLGFAAQLKFFASHWFFATGATDQPTDAMSSLAAQLGVENTDLPGYDFAGRSGRRHCAEILQYLGFRRMCRTDREELAVWIATEFIPGGIFSDSG